MPNYKEDDIDKLVRIAKEIRKDCLNMIFKRQAGHIGGSFSSAEIVTALFFSKMKIDAHKPQWDDRDRFILSKGHASALLYSALARRGFFPMEDLSHWGELTCHLQGHPDRLKTAGVDMTSGLLGHGVAIGAGLALGARFHQKDYHTYVVLGDGECQAGIVWEGAMVAAKYRLANLAVIVDYNNVQLDGNVHDIMPLENFPEKWRAFNWEVLEINGHNMRQILDALDTAGEIHHRPTVIIAHTTKAKGVSFMENRSHWHGIAPDEEQYKAAMAELEKEI